MSESSPAGEPDSSTDGDGKSVVCPTCERDDFKNTHGMRIHHAQTHGETISKTDVECVVCGASVRRDKYRVESQENVYCSTECQYEGYSTNETKKCEYCNETFDVLPSTKNWRKFCSNKCKADHESEKWVGENGPNWRGRIEITCKYCGDVNQMRPSRSHRKFCDKTCRSKWWSENVRGENHPNWTGESNVQCSWCGTAYRKRPSQIDRADNFYCTDECESNWKRVNFAGENNPNWRGGYDQYYGPNWRQQRRKARIRDQSRCQGCGSTPMDEGEELSVHHIKRLYWFKQNYNEPEWYEKGNSLNNLVCLCRSCHSRWEDIPLKPQLTK